MNRLRRLMCLAAAAFLVTACDKDSPRAAVGDVTFAKTTFESLARGDAAVSNHIDWPTFSALGENVGAKYVILTSDVEKERFVTAFITQFASSFRDSGGSTGNFTNWRTDFHDENRTDVAADSANGLLQLTVTRRDGIERVSALSMVK